MEVKDKAIELFNKMYQPIFDIDFGLDVTKDKKRYEATKQCALISINHTINSYRQIERFETFEEYQRLLEVKQEIEKL
jgi:hypothetical protein